MNRHSARWQAAALRVLLSNAGAYKRGPWVPTGEVIAGIQLFTACTHQAASGALKALRHVGLADSCETLEGGFWKATEAAVRADALLADDLDEAGDRS